MKLDNVDFGVVVALSPEMEAIKDQLDTPEEFRRGVLACVRGNLKEFSIVVAQSAEQGSVCSSIAASELIREFHPQFLVLLGIAAGFPGKIRRGDVVIADPIYGYEYCKVFGDYTASEATSFRTSAKLLSLFCDAQLAELDAPSMRHIRRRRIRVKKGPLASGNKVVASKEFRESLTIINRHMCAVEKEAEGVAQAARHFGYGEKFIVMKGISDFGDDLTKGLLQEQEAEERRAKKASAVHDDWQMFAARASAIAFAKSLERHHDEIRDLISSNPNTVIRGGLPTPTRCAQPVDTRGDSELKVLATFNRHGFTTVLRSPASCFLFGEHAVLEGHPALCLPLPLYVYVGISDLKRGQETCLSYFCPGEGGAISDEVQQDRLYCGEDGPFESAIAQAAPGAPALNVAVWSQAPAMCGLGTSSAISACIAKYLVAKNPVFETQHSKSETILPDAYDLWGKTAFNILFRTAWKIDLAFHTNRGSGAGVFAALAGTTGPRPLLYFSERPRTRAGDDVDTLPCWGFRVGSTRHGFEPSHFALVYTGHPKHTNEAVASPTPLSLSPCEDLKKVIESGIGEPTKEAYERLCYEFRHLAKPREMLMTAYGSAALAGINNFWAREDCSYLALMEACQCMHEVLGKTEIAPLGLPYPTREPYLLAQILNCASDRDGRRLFGAKITGAGMGGDIFVGSRITEGTSFSGILESTLASAREQYGGRYGDFGLVHFSSTWVDDYPRGYDVPGTSFVKEGGNTSH